jgi:Tfp pilus assembly protein PilN
MKKHPKMAFGISEDGQGLRLATLERDAYQVRLARLDLVELEKPLYRTQEQLTAFEDKNWESEAESGEILLEEYDSANLATLQGSPWERLFGTASLHRGVIAINVNEENLVRGTAVPENKSDEKAFARANLDTRLLKRGEWQTSRFRINGGSQFILHKGVNQLLEILEMFARRHRKRFYYQLADANDIALADYYRVNNLGDDERVLLVYLGRDYRKAFLFDKGQLMDIYPLNITQDLPEPELIYSRVAFALDNSQQPEPAKYVICGDLASNEILTYFNRRSPDTASLMSFPMLVTAGLDKDVYTPLFLAQFALPIALGHKAIYPDEDRYTQSNFLPGYMIEGQKPFKMAWHGYLIIFAIFLIALLGTISYLNGRSKYDRAVEQKRKLDHELTVLRIETAEIAKMQEEINNFSKNLDAIRLILKDKNPWSAVLDTLNHLFQSRPVSWLTNLKKEGNRLHISGQTTNRSNVIAFADALPNSRIQKVTSTLIHDTTIWTFEITSDFPKVDWVGQIEAEIAAVLEQNRIIEEQARAAEEARKAKEAEEQAKIQAQADEAKAKEQARLQAEAELARNREQAQKQKNAPAPVAKAPAVVQQPPAPQAAQTATTQAPALERKVKLDPITAAYMPRLTERQKNTGGPAAEDYNAFVRSLNQGNIETIKSLGNSYLRRYGKNRLTPMVRWHLANKLYQAGDYTNAISMLDPLVHEVGDIYPYALLLSARIDYARGYKRFGKLYQAILDNYPDHTIRGLVDQDYKALGLGGVE